MMLVRTVCTIYMILGVLTLLAQDDSCEEAITLATQQYNAGKLLEAWQTLENCDNFHGLSLSQKRNYYRSQAEISLAMHDYQLARTATEQLVLIDPFLKTVDKQKSPDLNNLIRDYRINTFSIEIHSLASGIFTDVIEPKTPPGASEQMSSDYSSRWMAGFGLGIQQRWYKIPIDFAFHLDYTYNNFVHKTDYIENDRHIEWDVHEGQHWIAPKLWVGYTFAPNALPLKPVSGFIKAGVGVDFLAGSRWNTNSTLTIDDILVIDSPTDGIKVGESYKHRWVPSYHASAGVEFRVHKQTIVISATYSFRSLRGHDNFAHEITAKRLNEEIMVTYVSDNVAAHFPYLQLAIRHNLYSTTETKD